MKINRRYAFGILLLICALFLKANSAKAYESGIHYYLTYIMGYECGLGKNAEVIALAAYSVDKYPGTDAGSHFDEWLDFSKESTRRMFHFPVDPNTGGKVLRGSDAAWQTVKVAISEASETELNPIFLGIGIHTLQDSYSHEGFGPRFGHWTQGPDLPKTDAHKLVEAAEATWIALNDWSLKVNHHGCQNEFKGLEKSLELWAALPLNSDAEVTEAWHGIAEHLSGTSVTPANHFQESEFQTAFELAANHVRKIKE